MRCDTVERVPAVALSIAGSDPSGGAGIQADLKTFHQFGVYGEAVITLLTVQNTTSVLRVETVPEDFVAEQIQAVISDIPPGAAKTGALGSATNVSTVAKLASQFHFPLVVDPVMMSTHGMRLISSEAEDAIRSELLPCGYLITPNLPEAEVLSGMRIRNEDEAKAAALRLRNLGCRAVLIKGGHGEGDPVDYLVDEEGFAGFSAPRIDTLHTHGTGCTYSAAITACLASGCTLRDSIATAHAFVHEAIASAPGLGLGHGPLNHFARPPRR